MKSTFLKTILRTTRLAVVSVFLSAGIASAADVYLQAQTFDKSLPDGIGGTVSVPMWGFQWCREGFVNCGQAAASQDAPGPQLNPHTINFGVQADGSGATLSDPGNPGVTISGLLGNGNPAASVSRTRLGIGVNNANVGTNQTAVFTYASTVVPRSFSIWSSNGSMGTVAVTLDGSPVSVTPVQGPLASLPTTHENAGGINGAWFTYHITGAASGTVLAIKNLGAALRVKDITAIPAAAYAAGTGPSLTVHLRNVLRTPTSITIPGQVSGGNPVMATDSRGRSRVQSFTNETARSGDQQVYTFSNLRPGTYLYQSGTQPSIQVPMGLYGALVVPTPGIAACTTAGQQAAYGANSCYNADATLLFSEIDPLQNQRAAAALAASLGAPGSTCVPLADYVANATVGFPCTVDYNPVYFLVNGEPYDKMTAPAPLQIAAPGSVLLRLLNAGLRSHAPTIVGLDMGQVAEDGNAYPGLTKQQGETLLPAGKALDAMVTMPAGNATYALFDRMPASSHDELPAGGMIVKLQVGTGSTPPGVPTIYAVNDIYSVPEGAPYAATPGVLDNDVGLTGAAVSVVSGPSNGTLAMNADGTFSYTPKPGFSGSDGFTYSASFGGNSYPAQVALNVSFVNDAPVAAADGPYVNTIGTTITVDAAHGVLGNDSDPDGDTLTAVLDSGSGVTLNADGSFVYSGGTSTTFTYHATDGTLSSASVTVTVTINPVANITLNVQDPAGTPVTQYRWLVEEDTTWQPDPTIVPPPKDTLATNFHRSYMPVVAQGCVGTGSVQNVGGGVTIPYCDPETPFNQLALDPAKHYYVSILPHDAVDEDNTGYRVGHTVGGTRIPPGAANKALAVNVNNEPLPYAQISIFVFEDNAPTNAAVSGGEVGLGGFQITLEDAGGRYGISAGVMSQDADGNPLTNALGGPPWNCFGASMPLPGVILSCPDTPANQVAGLVGQVLIKNLFQGKYGIIATPPLGTATQWVQTTTIEGTRVTDAWVKAGEPPFFTEFGPVGWHVFVGFVSPERTAAANPGGPNTVTGSVTNLHMARPPDQALWDSTTYDALAHTRPWVGLNSVGGIGPNFAAVQATLNPDGTASFEIPNVPNGEYQLVVWDSYLDQVIAYRGVSVSGGTAGTAVALGNVPVFNWFSRMEHNVFLDTNQNGVRDPGEAPLPEQAVNLRWRDGTVYQSFPTDTEGFVPFDQMFPFFHWQVAEVDYTRFKATGVTVTVDGGGDVSGTGFILNPQVQADGTTTRTETGPVLTQGVQGFLGQTSVFDWGKAPYAAGENGGISGIVYYASTRAESDPRLAVGEPWEPGIPRVKVRLYREVAKNGGGTALALVQEVQTDSWDDALPENCPGQNPSDPIVDPTLGVVTPVDKCYDGLRNFNQVRPAVFDGGYAFNNIPAGKYVVEVVPPPGYDFLKEEDVNVSFGDGYASTFVTLPGGAVVNIVPDPATIIAAQAPEPGLAQPPCVGAVREVPPTLSLFPSAAADAPFAGALRPQCDRKQVVLSDQGQAAADFFLFTGAPISGHFAGMILDDLAQEFSPYSPQFGEKWAPPFVPISVRDHLGREISRLYSDQWGRMNALVPSTFTANMPSPSGYSPAMHMTCMNDPGPIVDTRAGSPTEGQTIIDPQYNPAYSNFCYTFQYMPGTTTYLDTPVLPVSAFASGYNAPYCAPDQGTPVIRQVDGAGLNTGPLVAPAGTLTIRSRGAAVPVPNPAYEGPLATGSAAQATIPRDFGFGTQGPGSSVTIGGVSLTITSWDADTITASLPAGIATGELVVTRDNGNATEHAVTVTVSSNETPIRVPADQPTIQAAIDAASPGALILVAPGAYNESVIMWKPVRLQGAGAGSTFINAVKRPVESLVAWRTKMDCLFGIGAGCTQVVNALPNQPDGAAGFNTEEGAAITVVGIHDPGTGQSPANSFLRGGPSRIDGFSITGGDVGGGIFVNGYADRLEIANNHVFGNNGLYHGGIRIGRPYLELTADDQNPPNNRFEFNTGVTIHHNAITQNGGLGGAGGGLSIATGTDGYNVSHNFVCGNFTTGDGGGIGHLGLSDGGVIANNRIVFNQTFNQATTVSGGGLFIAGEPAAVGLTFGAGSVTVDANLIQGNHAGAGHGGGIRTQFVNGLDISNANVNSWHNVTLTNNMIVNNVAGWSGAGVSLQDTVRSLIANNTIVHNDSTATVAATFTSGNPNLSANQPAGIASEPHSPALTAAIPNPPQFNTVRDFSNPSLSNNIVWQNRSFHYEVDTSVVPAAAGLVPSLSQTTVGECLPGATYWDLGVLGGGFTLSPVSSVLTDTTGYDASNTSGDPDLLKPYCNGGRTLVSTPGAIAALPALDEGGNAWIDVRFGPLVTAWNANDPSGSAWDHHIGAGSSGLDNGTATGAPDHDFDGDARPQGAAVDRGADEVTQATTTPGTVAFNSSGAFGNVVFLTTETRTIIATVSGGPVTFVSSTNPAAPFAKTADTCSGTTVPTGGTCTFTVTYTQPLFPVTNNGSFTVTSNATGSPQTVNLSGTGVRQVAFTSATTPGTLFSFPGGGTLIFGNQSGLVTSTVTVTVEGSTPVTFGTLSVNNFFGTAFSKGADTCSGATLSGGGTCTVTVNFNAPTGNSFRGATLTASHNGANSVTQTLYLLGQ